MIYIVYTTKAEKKQHKFPLSGGYYFLEKELRKSSIARRIHKYHYVPSLEEYIRNECGRRRYLASFKTKNGYHVIAKREFNGVCVINGLADYAYEMGLTHQFLDKQNRPLVELKDNAMVLVAMGE